VYIDVGALSSFASLVGRLRYGERLLIVLYDFWSRGESSVDGLPKSSSNSSQDYSFKDNVLKQLHLTCIFYTLKVELIDII
jgi:hypothetical protein